VAAIRVQSNQYREFCERIVATGGIGYLVSILGRLALDHARTVDSYVGPFPPPA
jgi:hypothetical protein